jgi:hypothetical protein
VEGVVLSRIGRAQLQACARVLENIRLIEMPGEFDDCEEEEQEEEEG